jgi:mannan endo-1,4-beta-mannosidase
MPSIKLPGRRLRGSKLAGATKQLAHGGSHANRLLGPILAVSLVTIGTAVYLSPAGPSGSRSATPAADALSSISRSGPSVFGPTSPRTSASSTHSATPTPSASSSSSAVPTKAEILRETTRVTVTPKAPDSATCSKFKYQQDAQAAYVANLSDPNGLDGAAGPNNGDGLACTDLPVDPHRPASTPVDAYVPPPASAAEKSALALPTKDYFGVTQNGLPNATAQLTAIDNELGKAPSSIGYFSTWDQPFNATQVVTSWRAGALPVMTWDSVSSTNPSDSSYSFTNILAGNWDTYLYKYAGDIVRANLPLVIRFDHEMNGNWYSWSAGMAAYNNTPAKYIAVWQYVWNIFQRVGANNDVIWDWSPSRVDTLNPATVGMSQLSQDYPGDAYVDWVGATVYWRHSNVPTDFNSSFGKTIAQIRAITNKPMFFAEIGAIQSDTGVDQTAAKATWIKNTIAAFLADPSIVGFSWFDNYASTPDAPTVTNHWEFDSSPGVLAEFKQDISDPRFANGILPDGIGS